MASYLVKAAAVRQQILLERRMALESRDPIAIRNAGERFEAINTVLQGLDENQDFDLNQPVLSARQAARALNFDLRHLRKLIHDRKISACKVNNEWRIPLRAVL